MESPFKFFRKHQKAVLAFLTLMAMVGFTAGDVVVRMAGFSGRSRTDVMVESNVGKLSSQDVANLQRRRYAANMFVARAAVASGTPDAANFRFGSDSQPDVLFAWLLRKEANRLGIEVDNRRIDEFLDRQFGRKLTTRKFNETLDEMNLKPAELYDILRDELQALDAIRLARPSVPASPEQFWRYYQQIHTRQKIEVAAVPVGEFKGAVGEPTDAQIAALFEKHKSSFDPRDEPNRSQGGDYRPGFRQPRRVQLQYVKLGYEAAEAAALKEQPVTDDEIQAYYDEKKSIDLRLQEPPEPAPEKPGAGLTVPEDGDEGTEPATEAESKEQEATPDAEGGDAGAGEAPRPEPPASPQESATPEGQEATPEPPAESTPSPEPKSGCDDGPAPGEPPTEATEPAVEAQSPEVPAEPAAVVDDAAPSGEEVSETGAVDAAAETVDESAADAEMLAAPPETGAKPKTAPIRFKPLDDELKDVIRDTLTRDRTRAWLRKQSTEMSNAMFAVGQKLTRFIDPEEAGKKTEAERQKMENELQLAGVPEAAAALRKIAEAQQVEYGETDLVSPVELSEHPVLGKTQDVEIDEESRGLPAGIVPLCFQSQGLYASKVVEDSAAIELQGNRYVFWKVRDVPSHVPTLDEPGVREQVIAAWKTIEAQPKAKERAEELAKVVRGAESMEQALADQTVTGAKDSAAVTVASSPEFSWFRQSSTAMSSFGREQLELGNPVVIDGAGEKFMEKVFDGLKEGEVGVIPNDNASIYYVVKVDSRRPASRETFKSAPLFGFSFGRLSLPSQYQELAGRETQRTMIEFERQLEKRYAVKFRNPQTGEMVSSQAAIEEESDEEL